MIGNSSHARRVVDHASARSMMAAFAAVLALMLAAPSTLGAQDPPTAADPPQLAPHELLLRDTAAELTRRIKAPPFDYDAFAALVAEKHKIDRNDRWVDGLVGWFPKRSVKSWLAWNTPAEERTQIAGIDYEMPEHPFPVLVDLARQLARRDVWLVLAPVPARMDIYPDELFEVEVPEDFAGYAPHTRQFLRDLTEHGVFVVDLFAPLAAEREYGGDVDPLYLRIDPHWSPRGARIGARAIADLLLQLPGVERGPLEEGRDFFLRETTRDFDAGDDAVPPEHQQHETVHYTRCLDPAGTVFDARDRRGSIVVIGDSFVNFHRKMGGDVVSYLATMLGQRIDAISVAGDGIKQPRNVLRMRQDRMRGKTVVVWLLSNGALRPNHRWHSIDLLGRARDG